MPKILNEVKRSNLPVVFSFSQVVEHFVRNNPIIQIICSELLMIYYAFNNWKNTAPIGTPWSRTNVPSNRYDGRYTRGTLSIRKKCE